ncbi:hypothetical protein FZEAL_4027 [Fusarium zealandicum]|uniref:C2H2-type domain-containing protein n=1 Tax=Fusarium zealandicum TaxID=1053134 RepID=A0A8H4UMN2_9HYPO|nr:hypothetical protein FZEAL_4027 [Fusarium zealandicum]
MDRHIKRRTAFPNCGPTTRHRSVPGITTSPTTIAPAAKAMQAPKLTISSSWDEYIDSSHHVLASDFAFGGYRSASPVNWDPSSSHWASFERSMSTISCDTQSSSSAGSMLSSVQTDQSDSLTVPTSRSRVPSPLSRGRANSLDDTLPSFVCLGPQCQQAFASDQALKSHVKTAHTHTCNWAGCGQPSFNSRDGLVRHVNIEHLLVCPSAGCTESSFQSSRLLRSHIDLAHPETRKDEAIEWQLGARVMDVKPSENSGDAVRPQRSQLEPTRLGKRKDGHADTSEHTALVQVKRRCKYQLRNVVEKRARKNTAISLRPKKPNLTEKGTPRSADSPTDLVRGKASRLIETASFALVFEHAILPFLTEYLPAWVGSRHVVSVSRGKTPQMKRICIMTPKAVSRARKVIIVSHVHDLIPANFANVFTFVFTKGEVSRAVTWARGLGKAHMDDVCTARNPYFFRDPCMGDSIGVKGSDTFDDSTATLGPCLIVGGGSYWLGNFHPFVDAYQRFTQVHVEHPSYQDRKRCVSEGHDAMAHVASFNLGALNVTSGLNLKTTRISHESYWEECDKDKPLIVTDWALIAARTSQANMLRRFPSESQPLLQESIVASTAAIVPGANVLSSGRTSGYQRGQICEIPAYVSGQENGTQKATREWFIEEPWSQDDEEGWIRGGIGVSGDSGAAVVDSVTHSLVGQVWGRNNYWGPGQRVTYFTPISDIFDDIQEKCGQQTRPELPQHRDEADCFLLHPSCRQCFDLHTYLDSRRSSRISMQSMVMGTGDGRDQDLTSIEAVSELATPRDYHRFPGIEEAGSSFNSIFSPAPALGCSPGTPFVTDAKSPYAPTLDLEDLYEPGFKPGFKPVFGKRTTSTFNNDPDLQRRKRQRAGE